MGVYIVKTCDLRKTILEKEPYKMFLKKYHMLVKDEIWQSEICIDLTQSNNDQNAAFTIDRFYFSEPEMLFSFYNLMATSEQINRCLIRHVLRFNFDPCYAETIKSSLASIRSRQEYFYFRDIEELEIRYDVERDESAELVINAVTEETDTIESVCMSLISFDIAIFSGNF